ncbi:SDR family NAD(P)-dependent oxidoreductase [Thermobifida halotolerans]|uniref:SDR family NAD(P)-dependent oxidoreductase n=1 Tax=Thermobifida halotolerans TaxID=483545 RepID=A0A399FY88_9ACTN|nr:SDR family NAD(P)-dependent oxidoreductase [Thermobifida halotolerans]UOE19241.1 SDR family NAD(P)-dependent oxidoreductase [Thermobifida halotolerans]
MSDRHAHPRTALVTGASTGIGAEYARQLAERGYSLVLVARSADRLAALADDLADRYGVGVRPLPADLTRDADLSAVEERLRATGDAADAPIDLLVNNAGRGHGGEFATQPTETVDSTLALNIRALTRLARAVLPVQIGRAERLRGSGRPRPIGVINVASVAGLLPSSPGGAVYAASKAYVLSFTDTLAVETAGHGVRVSAVLPGYVRTDMTRYVQEMGLPDIAFVPKERVVADSLRGWAAGRVRVVPGLQYRAASALLHALPSGLFNAVARRVSP